MYLYYKIVIIQLFTIIGGTHKNAVVALSFESLALIMPAVDDVLKRGKDLPIKTQAATVILICVSEAFFAGVIFIILGYLKLGSLLHYIPNPVKQGAFGAIGYFLYLFSYNIQYNIDISTSVFKDFSVWLFILMHVLLNYTR